MLINPETSFNKSYHIFNTTFISDVYLTTVVRMGKLLLTVQVCSIQDLEVWMTLPLVQKTPNARGPWKCAVDTQTGLEYPLLPQ